MPNQSTLPVQQRPPLSALAMAWTALATFFVTSGNAWPIPFCAIAILGSRLLTWRFDSQSFAPWIVRLIVFAAIGLTRGVQPALASDWLMDARTVNILGLIASAEMTLQFWRESKTTRYQGAIVLLAGLVFLIASNTFEEGYIRILSPLFILCTVFALRDLQLRVSAHQSTLMAPRTFILRGLSLGAVLTVGFAMHTTLDIYRGELMSLGLKLLSERRIPQRVGMSMQPRLGSRFRARNSPQRVLRIVGNLQSVHLRAGAFDLYSRGVWGPPLNQRKPQTLPESASQIPAKPESSARITRLIDMEGGLLFSPLNVTAVSTEDGSALEYDSPNAGPLRSDDPSPYEYSIWESNRNVEGIPIYQGPLCAPLQPSDRGRYLQLPPELNPRVRELAERITREAWHPAERAAAIAGYLMANHQYSSRAQRGLGDPVSNFLLERRAAHCEYFASAAVLLLRSVGVPSRYVVGYLAHESDGPDTTIVRQRDAHAWAEAWIEGAGWVTVDATPGDGRPDTLEPISPWRKAWEKAQDWFAILRERMTQLSRAQWAAILVAVVVVWAISRLGLFWRKASVDGSENGYASPDERVQAIAARFENWLAQRHHAPPAEISWRKYLEDDSELQPDERKAALEFTLSYDRLRWGQTRNEEALHTLSDRMAKLENTLQKPASNAKVRVSHD